MTYDKNDDVHESMEVLETTTKENTDVSDAPILDGWNSPLPKPEDHATIMERMKDKIRDANSDPLTDLKNLINAPSMIQEEEEEDLTTPHTYPQIETPVTDDPTLEELGVLDDAELTDEQNPDVSINKLDDEYVPANSQEVFIMEDDELDDKPIEEEEVDELISVEDKDSDKLSPEMIYQLTHELEDKTPTDSTIPAELKDALSQVNNEQDIPEMPEPEVKTEPMIDEDDLIQNSLEDVPESNLNIPQLNLDDSDDVEQLEFNPTNALRVLVDIHETTVYGDDDVTGTFQISDMDEIKDNGLPYSRIVQANATQEEMGRYLTSTSLEALDEKANQLFSSNSVKGRIMREGLELLNDTLMDTNSYPHKMYMSATQNTTPNVLDAKRILESAKSDADKRNPDKKWLFSKSIQVKENDDEKRIISDQFADKSLVFDKIADHSKKQIKGNNAIKVASMLINGFRKINLFNSGFNVVIIAPTLQQLSKYYNTVYENSNQYGYDLGQLAYIPAGVEAKAALLDLWESCVTESNLADYQEEGVLRKALSVLDIPVISWALASLMYPRGTDIEHICYNTHEVDGKEVPCRHSEKVKISINDMRYNDWSKLTAEAVKYVDSKEIRTVEDCEKYRAKYLKDHGSSFVVHDDDTGVWKAVFKIPSTYTSEETHRTYIANMLSNVSSGTTENRKDIENYLRTKYLMSLSPYIDSITYTNIEGQKTLDFNDPDSLEAVLDQLQLLDSSSLPEKLMEYIGSKVVTHICYSHHPCPVCNKPAVGAVHGLIPCDPEYAFFVWVTVRLHQ